MHYHIILTEKCNLRCKYCYGKSMQEFENGLEKKFTFDLTEPETSQIPIQKLKTFISKDKDPTIIFYGGEPLLQIEKIKQIIDTLPNIPYRMQTNGILLDKLEPKYLNKITKILISIDGGQKTTDHYRGQETYQKILNNIKLIKQNNYKGELVARMTVAQDNPNIYQNVLHLINLTTPSTIYNLQSNISIKNKIFDSVHWQLDAEFYKFDYNKEKFQTFVNQYSQSITKLIQWWITEISNGKLHFLYPFVAITKDLLEENQSETKNQKPKTKNSENKFSLRCGAGHTGYAITTSGKIVACPIMNNIKELECGTLDSNPNNLRKIPIANWCENCKYLNICGGRCLYSHIAQLWPREGHDQVCQTIKHLIEEIKKRIPQIQEAINQNKISPKDFQYEKYFGPEIIP